MIDLLLIAASLSVTVDVKDIKTFHQITWDIQRSTFQVNHVNSGRMQKYMEESWHGVFRCRLNSY